MASGIPRTKLFPDDKVFFTNDTGYFKFDSVINIDNDGTRLDIFVCIYSKNDYVSAKYDTVYQPIFHFDTYPVENVESGSYEWNYGGDTPPILIDIPLSGYFYVADIIRDNHKYWVETLNLPDPGHTYTVLSDTSSSYYNKTSDIIIISNKFYPDYFLPDVYDEDVIRHEFGHRLHRIFGAFDDLVQAPSRFWTIDPPGLAAREGFAFFWSLASGSNNTKYYTSGNNYCDTFWYDLETGEYGQCGNGFTGGIPYDTTFASANAMGDSCSGANAGMFWDIYDYSSGTEDYSGQQDWGDTTLPHHPDDIGDSLSVGIGPIMNAIMNKSCGKPQTMEQFWLAWYNTPSEGHEQAMVDIWYEHGVDYHGCCVKMTGNTDCSFVDEPDISDVNRIIDFLYLSHDPLCCFDEADTYPDGMIDISDITVVIDYLYLSHTPLPSCP